MPSTPPAYRCVHYLGYSTSIDAARNRISTSLYDKKKGRPEFENGATFS